MQRHADSFDFILDTVPAEHDIDQYLNLLRLDGNLTLVGAPPKPLALSSFSLIFGRRSLSGSNVGGLPETQEMLDFCSKHNVTADVEVIPIQKGQRSLGACVVAADVSEQGNQETARLTEKQGGRARVVRCDVTCADDVKAALAETIAAFRRLDFAFNNAGIEPWKPAPTAEYEEEEEWNRIIDINHRGVFLYMKHEILLIFRQGGVAIVNVSSGAGIIGIKGSPAYTAAKHGVIGLTKAAALDYAAKNIRVNVVCPGYIDTPMMGRFTGGTAEGRAKVIAEEPVGRMGKPEGDRSGRHLVVLGRGRLHDRPRDGDRRRPNCAVMFVVNRDAVVMKTASVVASSGYMAVSLKRRLIA